MFTNFVKSYPMPKGGPALKYTTMVRHNGTVIAFAVNAECRILYSVLDLSDQPNKGPLDVNYWQDNPQELEFPNEIVTVGEGLFNPHIMPIFKKGSSLPEPAGTRVKENEKDLFRSTTASLSADAPIQALSDNKYVYVFRQSIGNDRVGVSAGTLLVDRFVLSGISLMPKREVRFQRSRNKYTPQSRKDGLGAKDMEQQPFFEPTQKLEFIRNLNDGRFTVLLLPTEIVGMQRWQIFAHNDKTGMIDSFNIERTSDGLFNLKGTQSYTCPDHPKVFQLQGGSCPEPAKADPTQNCPCELIPILSQEGYAEWSLRFDGTDDAITLEKPFPASEANYQTIEFWLKPEELGKPQTLLSIPNQDVGGIIINPDGALEYHLRGDENTPVKTFASESTLKAGQWSHVALVRDGEGGTLTWYINGNLANLESDIPEAAAPVTNMAFGGELVGKFRGYLGYLDEVRIWKRPRGQEEIRQDMRHRLIGHEPGLLLYWRFDEGAGTFINDQTENANHGLIQGDAEWVESDAPVGDHPGVRRTSFRFDGRQVVSGMTALLYYHQKKNKTGYDAQEKPLKTNARVMLAVATHPESGGEPGTNHIAVLDFGLSRDGKLAQVPDNIHLEDIDPGDLSRTSRKIQTEIEQVEQLIYKLKGNLDIPTDQPFLDAVFRKHTAAEEAEEIVFVRDNITISWSETGTEYKADVSSPPKTLAMASWVYDSGDIAEFVKTEDGTQISAVETEYEELEKERLTRLIDELKGNLGIPVDQPFLDAVFRKSATAGEAEEIVFVKDNITISWRETGTEYEAGPSTSPKTLAMTSWVYDSGDVAEFVKTEAGTNVSVIEPPVSGIGPQTRIGTQEWLQAWTEWGDPGPEAAFAFGQKYYYFKGNRYKVFDATTRQFAEPVEISQGIFPQLWPDGVDAATVHCDERSIHFLKGLQYKSYRLTEAKDFTLQAAGNIHDIYPGVPFLFLHPEYEGELPDLAEVEQQLADLPGKTVGTPEWCDAWTGWGKTGGEGEGAFVLGKKFYYFKGRQYKVFNAETREFTEPVDIDQGVFPGLWPDGVDAALDQTNNTVIFFKGPRYQGYQLSEDGFSLQMAGNIHDIYPGVPFLFLHPEYKGELPDLAQLETDLENLRLELAAAQKRELADLEVEIEMHLVHTDPFGLTTLGGLLTFAWTVNAPLLFDSANGKLALYFRGANNQFYVAYYDTMTGTVTFEAPAGKNTTVVLIPRLIGPVNDTVIEIEGENAESCTVALKNPALKLSETWQHVPRQATEFASVLNGLGAPVFLGRLAEALSGNVRGVKISAATPEAVKPGRVLTLGAATAQITGVVPLTALAFDGVDDYVELPEPLIGDAGTIEMWIRFSETTNNQAIFDASTRDKYFFIDIQKGKLRFALEDQDDQDFELQTDFNSLEPGEPDADWHHLVAVWDYQNIQEMCLYLDGERVALKKEAQANKTAPKFLNPFIGESRSSYKTSGKFKGQIAEVCIRQAPLLPAEVKANYELGLFGLEPEPMAGCWRFQQANGSPAALDCSAHKRDGILHGAPTLPAIIAGGGILVNITPLELLQELSAGEPIYTDYDYENNMVFNHHGRESRSMLFTVDASQAEGMVQNGTITASGDSPMTRWVAYSQGSALEFDGQQNHVSLTDNAKLPDFDAEGDLTLEVWARPEPLVDRDFSRIVHHYSDNSRYMLGLQRKPLKSAIELNADRTAAAEAWAAAQFWHPFVSDNWAVAAKNAAIKEYNRIPITSNNKEERIQQVADAAEKAARDAVHFKTHLSFWWRLYERDRAGALAREWALSWAAENPDYVKCQNTFQINPGDQAWTIELWFRANRVDGERMLYHKDQLYGAAVKDGCFQFNWSPHGQWVKVADFPVDKNRWYHAAITYGEAIDDPESQRGYRVYKDGQLILELPLEPEQTGPMGSNDQALLIGARSGPGSFFEGAIDEVRVWSVARTKEQIGDNMNRRLRGVEENLVGYWHFEAGLARDYSGYENHGMVQGTPVVTASTLPGYAVTAGIGSRIEGDFSETYIQTKDVIPYFDWNHLAMRYNAAYALRFADDGAYLDCGNNASLNLGDDLSIEVFLRLDDLRQPRGILTKGEIKPGYSLYVNTQGRVVFTHFGQDGNEYAFTSNPDSALEAGNFYRIAVTRQHQSETREVSQTIEGENVTIPQVEEWDDIEIHVCKWNGHAYDRYLGLFQRYDGPKPDTNSDKLMIGRASSRRAVPFKGIISEVRLWNRALGRFETCQNITGFESGLVSWWRLDENNGYAAADTTGTNPASINLADWVRNPDPAGSSFRILNNGAFLETEQVDAPKHVLDVPPIVFVAEYNAAGNWIFFKTDKVTGEGFTWATRPIDGRRINYATNFAWIAINPLASTAPAGLLQAGSKSVTFTNASSLTGQVQFEKPFEAPPIVFVAEYDAAGNWIFFKTNKVTEEGFTWAARPIDNKKITYATNFAWIAINPLASAASAELIQAGSKPVTFTNTNYLRSEVEVQFPESKGFSLGSRSRQDAFKGTLEELRIWRSARTQEQIQDNLFLRLLGEKEDLIAYYTFDQSEEKILQDHSFRGNHLNVDGADGAAFAVSDAPISYDTFQVRNALLGVKTAFHDQIHSQPGVQEYGDMQYDAEGNLIGILKRCYSYIKNGQWYLVTGYKVGNLVTEWIGQVQFNPELKGYVEGAPPVPSENLTAGPMDPADSDYTGVAAVEVVEADNVTYTYATSKETGLNASFGLSAQFGVDTTVMMITAPLGFGTAQEIVDVNVLVGLAGKFDTAAGWSSENVVGVGRNLTKSTKITLGGNWEDPTKPLNKAMRRRYQPANVGFALVQSETADVFALRLAHNLALVSYQFRPNPDIPKDWNIIPFPINPRYTKQGTLDGAIGYDERGKVLDPDYPNAREYGQHSYFKPKEAYALKNRIIKEEQELANYFRTVDTSLNGAQNLAISAGLGLIGGAAGVAAGAITGLVSALETNTNLPEKLGKQNIVNTYVWTADGGFFAETTETTSMKQETTGGSFSFGGEVGATIGVDFSVGSVDVSLGYNAMLGGSINLTKTKTKAAENSFRIDLELDVPGDLQAYDENLNRKYDPNGNPIIVPGKVDAYRFMTFYLEPNNENFETFFNSIIDPIWLQGNHPNALALKQAQQINKKPPCWRVMHRVTFVSRILPEIPDPTAPPLEKNMKAANIESNWQLIKKLEPFVSGKTANFVEFSDAIHKAIKTYFPELTANVEEIIQYLSAYYQVYEE